MKRRYVSLLATISFSAAAALAQSTSSAPATATPGPAGQSIEQRKDNQQQRIGNGVDNGSLTAGETGKLEGAEKHLNKEERNMRSEDNGKLSAADRARLNRQQNGVSRQIYTDKHNAAHQPGVNNEVNARDRRQQERIGQGIKNGSLTPSEASNLEHKEARLNGRERGDRAANGGRLTPGERGRINGRQNQVSRQIYRKKHNGRRQH